MIRLFVWSPLVGSVTVFLALGVLVLAGCPAACDGGPTSGTPITTTTTPPERPPRVDQPFLWDRYRGFTAFALGHPGQTEADIQSLFAEAMAHGWNTARRCAELENWDGTAEYPQMPRDIERLRWFLDVVARIPGAQVLLIGDCTLKGPVSEPEKREWAAQVAQIAREFHNVAIETHNEFDNCRGRGWGPYCPGKADVREHVKIYRDAGIQYVTADDSLCWGPDERKTYEFRLENIGAWPADFHPCRERHNEPWDPTEGFLNRVRDFNGEPFVISEPVAWMDYSGRCDGLRTCDQTRINTAIKACAAVSGCRWTFHSENLLAGKSPTWWPEAR